MPTIMWMRNFCLIFSEFNLVRLALSFVLSAGINFSSTVGAAEPLPELCRPLPNFAQARSIFLDAEHKALAEAALRAVKDKDIRVVRERLRQRLAKEVATNPYSAAVIEVELLNLSKNNLSAAEIKRMRADVRRELVKVPGTPAGAEALGVYALGSDVAKASDRDEIIRAAIATHHRLLGGTERQYLLWERLYQYTKNDDEKLALSRQIFERAPLLHSEYALFESELRLYHDLPDDDPLNTELEKIISKKALIIANTPVPAKDSFIRSCYLGFANYTTDMTDALSDAGSIDERKTFVRLAAQHLAGSVEFGTHAGFVQEDMRLVLSVRNIDRSAYLEAVARFNTGDSACKEPDEPTVVCNLLGAAQILFINSEPFLALVILRDAQEQLATANASEALRWHVHVAVADAEWDYGSKPIATMTVNAMRVANVETSAKSGTIARFHRLRAKIADANLDVVTARESFAALIDLAMRISHSAPSAIPDAITADGPSRSWILADEDIDKIADELVERHIRGQFCVACGAPFADAALAWIRDGVKEADLKPIPAAWAYLTELHIQKRDLTKGSIAPFEKAVVSAFEKSWTQISDIARRSLKPGASPSDVVQLVALAALLADANGYELNVRSAAPLFHFLVETDAKKMPAIWHKEVEQFMSGDPNGMETFNTGWFSLAYNLADTGYTPATKFILQLLVGAINPGASEKDTNKTDGAEKASADPDTSNKLKVHAAFWASAYARLAAIELADKDWGAARSHLALAQQIVGSRLEDGWTTSADQMGPLIHELRDVLQMVAELRLVYEKSAPSTYKSPTMAFQALQLAMLGDTAAGMQASLRRRLIGDPTLQQTMRERDDLKFNLELLHAFDSTLGAIDQAARDAQDKAIEEQITSAEQKIASALPVSETIGSLKPLVLADATALLQPDEGLLILHAGRDAIYGSFSRAYGEPKFWRSQIAFSQLASQIALLRQGINLDKGLPVFPLAVAHDLFQKLVGPNSGELAKVKRLLVMADGPLLSFPLGALPSEMPDTVPRDAAAFRSVDVKWLGLSHAIAYLPTLRALEVRRYPQLKSTASRAFSGIGNPLFGALGETKSASLDYATLYKRGPVADGAVLRRLPPLPETETELRTVASLLGARDEDLFLGKRATVTDVRRNGLTEYRILMFSTHGIMGGELSGMAEPGIVLTPPENPSPHDDGVLSASAIASMKLDADLVILSACNTAAPDGRPRAEGFSGLTRSFLSAGARAVVVTHWSIPSLPTVALTTTMVQERQRHPDISWSEALRRSFVAMVHSVGLPDFAHPANWAAFVLVGAENGTHN